MIERESEREYHHNRCCSNEEIAFPQLDYYGTCETHFLWRGLVSYPLPVYSNIYDIITLAMTGSSINISGHVKSVVEAIKCQKKRRLLDPITCLKVAQ